MNSWGSQKPFLVDQHGLVGDVQEWGHDEVNHGKHKDKPSPVGLYWVSHGAPFLIWFANLVCAPFSQLTLFLGPEDVCLFQALRL